MEQLERALDLVDAKLEQDDLRIALLEAEQRLDTLRADAPVRREVVWGR